MKYRKKPVIIEAIQWNGNNLKEVMEFIGSEFRYDEKTNYITGKFTYYHFSNYLAINTLEGSMVVSTNDYIIKGIQGEFYPCKPDIFEQTYDEVEERMKVDLSKKEIQVILDHLGLNICNTDCYMGYKTNMCYKGCKLQKIIDNIYAKFNKEVEENE